ncbi:hypothetical protein ACHAWF_016469 [Thalassiosira exigua]
MLALATLRSSQAASIQRMAVRALSAQARSSKVALVLSGCGVYDGTEVTEAVSALVHLSRAGAEVSMFAPDKEQMHVIDHTKGEPSDEKRNVLAESARIARGDVAALDKLKADDFDAVIIPGGFGAAKNLSSFATEGPDMTVDESLEKILLEFNSKSKPIGACCISPTILAKVFGGKKKVELTVGGDEESESYPYAGAAGAIKAMGAGHTVKGPAEACVDGENKIVTSSAYMYAGKPHEIDDSVKAMVDGVLAMT